jgi:hypothetical protein
MDAGDASSTTSKKRRADPRPRPTPDASVRFPDARASTEAPAPNWPAPTFAVFRPIVMAAASCPRGPRAAAVRAPNAQPGPLPRRAAWQVGHRGSQQAIIRANDRRTVMKLSWK